jgi:hypothetical protein
VVSLVGWTLKELHTAVWRIRVPVVSLVGWTLKNSTLPCGGFLSLRPQEYFHNSALAGAFHRIHAVSEWMFFTY